jgi:hypothetical protein
LTEQHRVAADLLSATVHCDTTTHAADVASDLEKLPDRDDLVDLDDLGIWIDPIGK